ncbi:MAG: class I SAM-dependent methyltransferase [Pseudomonadota bacterium]
MVTLELPIDIDSVKGFLSREEGEALYRHAATLGSGLPAVEIGSYCGKSSVYLGLGCRKAGSSLFAVDHHRGSEEHQPGEFFHDPELVDSRGRFSTLESFRDTIADAGLEDSVIPVLASSAQFAASWAGPIGMVFIDGGHSLDAALTDYRAWAGRLCPGGILAVHDVYPNSEDGGQAPITVFRMARDSGLFAVTECVDSLRVLQRL